jgi:hypothetical protein
MDAEDHKWIQMAQKHLRKGAFTKKATAHGETPKEFMKEVLANPAEHDERTRKQAQFMKNIQPAEHHSEKAEHTEMKKERKPKRAPTAWNQLVQKHYAMVKGEPDAFQKAIKMAKDERSAPPPKKEEEAPKKKRMSKKKAESMN